MAEPLRRRTDTMVPHPNSIVFMVPGFPVDESDTGCLPAVQNYIAGYAAAHPECRTHVLAFQYPFTRRTYAWKHATVHALAGRNRRGPWRLWTWLQAAERTRSLHKTTRIRVLHSFWLTECTWVGQWLSKALSVRHVATIAGQDALRTNPYLRFLDLRGAILTAGSPFAAETFRASTGRRVDHVIPLGLDLPPATCTDVPRDIDLLGVGSLAPVKNFSAFVHLVAALLPAFPELKTWIVGEGPQRDLLLRQIAALGLERHIHLPGRLPREDVLQLMKRSRLLLHPALYEAQGYVFLEALSSGLHVVCFDVGYPGDSDRVYRCTSEAEMLPVLHRLLCAALPHHPVPVPTVHETVHAYEQLYAGG